MVMVNSKVESVFTGEVFLMSFVAQFDRMYAAEEQKDFEETLNLFSRNSMEAGRDKRGIEDCRLLYVDSCDDIMVASVIHRGAGVMAYRDPASGAYYVGLLRSEYKDLFNILFHKLFMERNANKFMEIKRLEDVPEDFKGIDIEMLKEAA